MLTKIQNARKALHLLGDLDREIPNLLSKEDDKTIVEMGQWLWWIAKRVKKALDPIKDHLRAKAVEESKGNPGSLRYASADGSHCMVTIPKAPWVIRKDADMERLKSILGEDFDLCFNEVRVYSPQAGLADTVKTLEAQKAQAVLAVIDVGNATPKVAFKD